MAFAVTLAVVTRSRYTPQQVGAPCARELLGSMAALAESRTAHGPTTSALATRISLTMMISLALQHVLAWAAMVALPVASVTTRRTLRALKWKCRLTLAKSLKARGAIKRTPTKPCHLVPRHLV